MTIALRTQQIIAHESGVANVVDPLGGSYFVEKLTTRHGARGARVLRDDRRDGRHGGGDRAAATRRRKIAESAYRFQQAVERREKIIVGVNDFVAEDEAPVPTLYIDEAASERQLAKLERLRRERDNDAVERALDAAARGGGGKREHDGRRSSKPFAPTRRLARCATRCARCGASTRKCRWSKVTAARGTRTA